MTKGLGLEGEGLADSKAPLPSRNASLGALKPDSEPVDRRKCLEDIPTSKGTGSGCESSRSKCSALFIANADSKSDSVRRVMLTRDEARG